MARVAALALTLAVAIAAPATAKTFEPTRKDDPVPNGCKPRNCSFREALLAANRRSGHDVVVLGRGTYEMEIPRDEGLGEDGNWWGYDVTVRGQGRRRTTLDANGLDTVMQLGNFGDVNELRDLRVTGGNTTRPGAAGGISGFGFKVTLERVVLVGNTTGAGSGGGANLHAAIDFEIIDSRVVDNEAFNGGGLFITAGSAAESTGSILGSRITGNEAVFGGGVYSNLPDLTISRSTIAQNTADEGGGMDLTSVHNFQPATRIGSSTISGNTARKGGGFLADGNQPQPDLMKPIVTVVNSTVAGNDTSAEGGGIMADNGATVNLDNATVAYNMADTDNIGGGIGGGVHQHSGAVLGVGDSIVAANSVGTSGTGPQCYGALSGADGFVYESQSTGSCSFGGDFTIVGDAGIAPLGANGGPTQTVKLFSGGPAIGFAKSCPGRDQRGRLRPPNCDSGAFENKPRRP